MHATRVLPAALHCKISPDGTLVATLEASFLTIRSFRTLQTLKSVKLPSDLTEPISAFLWSPSSSNLLVAAPEQIHVYSAVSEDSYAVIRNFGLGSGKSGFVRFGAKDSEIIACAASGLKFTIFDLLTSKGVEINHPKFYTAASATLSYSLRQSSGHLAVLTRVDGKDTVSIHGPSSRQVQRSWHADTIDAQGILWSPDGHWLVLWESPAQGHRLIVHSANGEHFRTITAAKLKQEEDPSLEAGIRLCCFSPDSTLCVIGDFSKRVDVLDTHSWRRVVTFDHPNNIVPVDTLQIWQERLGTATGGPSNSSFHRATQEITPPSHATDTRPAGEVKQGCSNAKFDMSSTLLATTLDDAPSTLWIWDVPAAELRAVLIFHSIIGFTWHTGMREVLLISCRDEARLGLSYVWDPLWQGPSPVFVQDYLPSKDGLCQTSEKYQTTWSNSDAAAPTLFISNSHSCRLLTLGEPLDAPSHRDNSDWTGAAEEPDFWHGREVSTLAGDDGALSDNTFSFKGK